MYVNNSSLAGMHRLGILAAMTSVKTASRSAQKFLMHLVFFVRLSLCLWLMKMR